VAVRSLASVIIDEYRSTKPRLRIQSFSVYAAPIALLVNIGATEP
jgi:hypothetical protein